MAELLYRLGRASARRARTVLAAWLAVLVLAGAQKDKDGRKLQGYEQNKKLAWIVTGVLVALSIVSSALNPPDFSSLNNNAAAVVQVQL